VQIASVSDFAFRERYAIKNNYKMCFFRSFPSPNTKGLLWAADALRNEIAHNVQTDEIQKKMDRLRKMYLEVLTPQQMEHTTGTVLFE